MHKISRGDLYYVNLNPVFGSEQGGVRPALILQNDVGNKFSPTVIIAAITSQKEDREKLPTHFCIGSESGLEHPSIIMLEQLRTIDKKRLKRFVGHLDKENMRKINQTLLLSLGVKD